MRRHLLAICVSTSLLFATTASAQEPPARLPARVSVASMSGTFAIQARPGDLVDATSVTVAVPQPGGGAVGLVDGDSTSELLAIRTGSDGKVAVTYLTSSSSSTMVAAGTTTACQDDAFYLLDPLRDRWRSTPTWYFRSSSTPKELTVNQAEDGVTQSLSNIATARNDCGHSDFVDIGATYGGRTTLAPSMWRGANSLICDTVQYQDGKNVISFTDRNGAVAAACIASKDLGVIGDPSDDGLVEVDIVLDKAVVQWYVQGRTTCGGNKKSVEAVVTHELGHGYGLDHVVEASHPELTMSDGGIQNCQNSEATLGMGDWLGLEALY